MTRARAKALADVHKRDEVVSGQDEIVEAGQGNRERKRRSRHPSDIRHQFDPADPP
jgi:hypothetical protein